LDRYIPRGRDRQHQDWRLSQPDIDPRGL
jgi:hypothetical protein